MNKLATMIFGLAGCATLAVAQTNNVKSAVVSGTTGEPVSGASVVVTGTDIATTTDINGQFSIDAPKEYKTLTVSHANMQPAVVNILPEPIVMSQANSLMSGWGVEAGLSSTTVSTSESDDEEDFRRRSNFTIGVTYDYPIQAVPNLSVMGGLFYVPKGLKIKDSGDDVKYNANYLELQATAKYSYPLPVLNNDLKAFALAGPYIAYGLGGKMTDEDYEVSTFDMYKRFDAGVVLGFGVEYKRYSLTCRWGIGLTNIFDADKAMEVDMKEDYYNTEYYYNNMTFDEFKAEYGAQYSYDGDYSIKNRSFMLTLGYRF